MAHRPLTRRTATVGLTAALLTVPMAAPAAGLGDALDGVVDEATDTVDRTLDGAREGVEATLGSGGGDGGGGGDAAGAVDGAVNTVTGTVGETVDGVRDVVEKAASGDVEGAVESTTQAVGSTVTTTTDAVDGVLSGGSGGQEASDGGGATQVAQPVQRETEPEPEPSGPTRAGTAARLQPDQSFNDRSVSSSSGFVGGTTGTPEDPSAYSAPATSGVFDEDADDSGGDRLRSAQDPDVASLSSVPSPGGADGPSAAGVPGTLLATATALLVLVGAGHALHGLRRLDFG